MTRGELEDRLIDFSVAVMKIGQLHPKHNGGAILTGQMVRACTSTALNYGEAQSAESPKDFIHKMQIVLKELRETMICLKIIKRGSSFRRMEIVESAMKENNELIAIFVKSIHTAKKRNPASR